MRELTFEEKKEKVKDFRVIDDAFFEVVASNKEVCQEMLRVILEDPRLIVEEVIVQDSERNLYGKSIRLDALCILSDGVRCNIEVQRSDNDDHLKRVRFNASMITVKDSNLGENYRDVKEVYVIYISEFDFLKGEKTIYHVDKILRETGMVIDDGLHEIFVNTVVDDGTDIAELMSCFTKKEVKNSKFPKLSSEVTRLKETEGGVSVMCSIMEKEHQEGRREGRREGRQEGRQEERVDSIKRMLKSGKLEKEDILDMGYSEEEYQEAEKKLFSMV